MTLINQLILFFTAFWNLIVRIVFIPFAVVAWLSTLAQSWRTIIGLVLIGAVAFFVAQYGGTVVTEAHFVMTCRISPYFNETIRPILAGIVREFFNRIVCWYNGILYFPYGLGREVIFPILREGGFGAAITALGRLFTQIGSDFFIGYFATGRIFSQELDTTQICLRWQEFWMRWQSLLCFGCNDLCPYFTKLPIVPAFFASDQMGTDEWWCFLSNMFNGIIYLLQRIIYTVREIIWPTGPVRPRFEFKRAFDLFCRASTCFWRSWEIAMQTLWDNFVPFEFQWIDTLCVLDKITCAALRTIYLALNIIVNFDRTIDHFIGRPTDFWTKTVRRDFEIIVNTIGRPTDFETIEDPLPLLITSYHLSRFSETAPDGTQNPLFNMKNAGDCLCLTITRILCDPQNNGTTCEQRFNGTLLSGLDPCCFGKDTFTLIADLITPVFDITLRLKSINEFVLFLDRQPFTKIIKKDLVRLSACLAQIFLAVQTYGSCLAAIAAELADFMICLAELMIRISIAIITLPYFDAFLPGYTNFITQSGNESALAQGLIFLDRLGDTQDPNGLINCLCFTLNTGFNVPFAGCNDVPCQPTGFIDPITVVQKKRLPIFERSFYNLTSYSGMYAHRLSPILHNHRIYVSKIGKTAPLSSDLDFQKVFDMLDDKARIFADKMQCRVQNKKASGTFVTLNITTNTKLNCTDPLNPPPCFNLCCFPKKVIILFVHTVKFVARSINAGFQSRFNPNGSGYWDGEDCMNGGDCFQSDATMFIAKLFAPIECLCEFLKLVIPPQGFSDPCCAFSLAAELLSCFIQIIINVANSINGDSPNFTYIKDPQFLSNDFDILLDIALLLFDCACDFVRSIFGVAAESVGLESAFDPCCVFRVWFRAILEILRLAFRAILSISTPEQPENQCYLYVNGFGNARPQCPLAVADIGIVKQFQKIIKILFAPPISELSLQQCAVEEDLPNIENDGLPTCLCRAVNSLLAMVFEFTESFTGNFASRPKCVINLCCIIYSYGRVIKAVGDFVSQLVATLWQNWEPRTINILGSQNTYFIPQETMYFFFCNEYGSSSIISDGRGGFINNPMFYGNLAGPLTGNSGPYAGQDGIVNPTTDHLTQGVAEAKCGELEPAIRAIQDLLGGCLCQQTRIIDNLTNSGNGIANVLDDLVRWLVAFASGQSSIFPRQVEWPRCFCSGGPDGRGIIRPAARAFTVLIRQVTVTIRNVANPTFWVFDGGTLTDDLYIENELTDNFNDIRKTWINRFLAPFADAMCELVTNLGCVLSMILGNTCSRSRYNVLSSASRYYFEAIIRLASLIEAAVKLFTQEPPGLCIGSTTQIQGNIENPQQQGSTGETGEPIPTCSPTGGFVLYGGIDSNQIGRILNANLAFVADALIGIGRYTCTEICPGFDPEGVQTGNRQSSFGSSISPADGTIISQNSVCNCWNDSPFTGLRTPGGSVCGFKLCDDHFNSGLGTFKCPNDAQECNFDAADGPPNTGNAINNDVQDLKNNQFCQRCSNDTSLVDTDDRIYIDENTISWRELGFPLFQPIALKYQQSGLACQIRDPLSSSALKTLTTNVGEGLFKPVPIVPFQIPLIGSTGNILVPITDPDEFCNFKFSNSVEDQVQNVFVRQRKPFFPGACYVQNQICTKDPRLLPDNEERFWWRMACVDSGRRRIFHLITRPMWAFAATTDTRTEIGQRGIPTIRNACRLCRMAMEDRVTFDGSKYEATYQHTCDRPYCVQTRGLCKNDQMVPCSIGGPILDGVIVSGFKYIACLMKTLFGNFPFEVVRFILLALSFVWQLSGGIIRFAVTVVMGVLEILFRGLGGVFGWANIPRTISRIISSFINIFRQPIALGYKRDTLSDPIMGDLKLLYSFDDAHDCIDFPEPAKCFCRVLDMRPFCTFNNYTLNPPNLTTSEALMYLRDHFGGETNCDMLLQNLAGKENLNWLNISYAERFEAVQCLTWRSKGERFNMLTSGTIPKDFFYSPRAWYKVLSTHLKKARGFFSEEEEEKKPRALPKDNFKKRFKMSRNEYFKFLNSRSHMVKRYYIEEQGFSKDSPIMHQMLRLEMYHYMYQSNYFRYLYDEANMQHFIDKLPTFEETLEELADATVHLFNETKIAWQKHVPELEKFTPFMPETPALIRIVMDGSLKRAITSALPELHFPTVKMNPPVLENVSFWPRRVYKDHIERNINAGLRMIYSASHYIWPHHTTKDVHERFIINGDCRVVDGTVQLGTRIVDYCLSEFQENIQPINRSLGNYLRQTSHLRNGTFANRYRGRHTWNKRGSGDWRRPRIDFIPLESRTHVHSSIYHRAVPSDSLFGKILTTIGSFFGVDLKQTLDNFIVDLQAWVSNPNTSITDWPNVGARYWITFAVRCEFPENLNCSIGIGLGAALWRVGLVYFIVFIVLALIFPGLLSALSVVINVIVYALIVAIVAWHYSPSCIALFPSSEISGIGVTVPVLPIPLNIFPLLPECLWDDIIGILDTIFAACYTWIPLDWINGPQCPTCPAKIDLPNCADVGISTPLQVLIFWGDRLIGSLWCDLMRGLSTSIAFQWIPGFTGTTADTCDLLATATETQLERMRFCGWLSLPTLAWFALGLWIIGLFLISIVPAILNAGHAMLLLLPTLPLYDAVVGLGQEQGAFILDGEEDEMDEEVPVQYVPTRQDLPGYIASGLRRFMPHQKTE